jgi:hypothetical protein
VRPYANYEEKSCLTTGGWRVFLVLSFSQSTAGGIFVLLVGPVIALIYLAFIRMTLEFYLAIVRMSQDIHQRQVV